MHEKIRAFINLNIKDAKAELITSENSDSAIVIASGQLLNVAKLLKESNEFDFRVLQLISAVDYPEEQQIHLNYFLCNFRTPCLDLALRVKVDRKNPTVDSLTAIWKSADWLERECFDLFGVTFNHHPDLKRILCPDDWQGHPLLKDYVPALKYNGMAINPASKMNTQQREFANRQKQAEKDGVKITRPMT